MDFEKHEPPFPSVGRAPQAEASLIVHLFEQARFGPLYVSLRDSRGFFVCAELGHGPPYIMANRTECGEWERFMLVPRPDGKVALRAHHGHYVCAEPGEGGRLVADREHANAWEFFTVEFLEGGYLAFKSWQGRYVSVDPVLDGGLIANRDTRGPCETFELLFS